MTVFVGGSNDGKRSDLFDGQRWCVVPLHVENTTMPLFTFEWDCEPAEQPVEMYRRETIMSGSTAYSCFLHTDIPSDQLVHYLMRGYLR
jgi:hypothetical protein